MIKKILSILIHHANREGRNEQFYKIKNRILAKYGKHIGYDIQFIEGKMCYSCEGTGIHYDEYGIEEDCWKCYSGWYKRPTWNILQRLQFGKYIFHQPYQRVYKKPEEISIPVIEGYIDHNRSKHGKKALFILFLLYEKGYLKRWYKESGKGWRMYWWKPKNYINNLIHLFKNGRNAYPIKHFLENHHWYWQVGDEITDELPF